MATGRCLNDSIQLLKQLSKQSSEGVGDEFSFQDELELLQNVYFDELEIIESGPSSSLSVHITPSTADDKDKQFVYVVAMVTTDTEYPQTPPTVSFVKSRGLSDAHLDSILAGVAELANEHLGNPMIYDLVEYIRDCLTNNNRPYGRCVLCQYEFQEDDKFLRTKCFHYFHPNCLLNYASYCEQKEEEDDGEGGNIKHKKRRGSFREKLECPVCRVLFDRDDLCNIKSDSAFAEYNLDFTSFKADASLIAWQKEMAILYQKQLAQGGIINLTDETIDETWVSSRVQSDKDATPIELEADKPITDFDKIQDKDKMKVEIKEAEPDQFHTKSMATHKNSYPESKQRHKGCYHSNYHSVNNHTDERHQKDSSKTGRRKQEKVVIIVQDKKWRESRQQGRKREEQHRTRRGNELYGKKNESSSKNGNRSLKSENEDSQNRSESVKIGNKTSSKASGGSL